MGKNFIDNEQFLADIKTWKNMLKKDETIPITDSIARTIKILVQNYLRKPSFSNYTYKDKMESEAIYLCLKYAKNFDETKYKNPFAYFTRIAWSGFIKIIYLERKIAASKKEIYEKLFFDYHNGYAHDQVDYIYGNTKYTLEDTHDKNNIDVMFDSEFNVQEFSPVTMQYNGITYHFKTQEEYTAFNKEDKKLRKELNKKMKKEVL